MGAPQIAGGRVSPTKDSQKVLPASGMAPGLSEA